MILVAAPKSAEAELEPEIIEDVDERPAKAARRRDPNEEETPRKASARRRDEDEDEAERRPSRRRREEDDEDKADRPRRGGKSEPKSKLPLILGGLLALLIGGGAAGFFLMGGEEQEVAQNANPEPSPAPPDAGKKAMPSIEGAKDSSTTKTTGEKKAPVDSNNAAKSGTSTPSTAPMTGGTAAVTPPMNTTPMAQTEPKTTPPVKTTPATEPVEVGRGGRTTSSGVSEQDVMDGRIPTPRQDSAIAASVFIKCETNYGGGTGSGWCGVEPGLVFTNAHVLDMKSPNSPEPKKLTLYLNSGKSTQREIPHSKLKILAVDHEMDLAVIQIIGEDNLPAALQVKPSSELKLGQTVFTVGFPLGGKIAAMVAQSKKEPEVMWRRTFFSGLERKNGEPRAVKLEGGVTSGNSGGAIVDATGDVVAVVVATTTQSAGAGNTIGLAVPTEYVKGMIAGRVADVTYGTPYKDKDQVKIPVIAKVLNPLKKSLTVRIRGWVADANDKIREPGTMKPVAEATDAGSTDIELTYDPATQTAKGDIPLPTAPAGRAYFAQPYYTNAYTTYAMPGIAIPMNGPPVDRVATNLTAVRKEGTRRIATLTSSRNQSEHHEGEEERKEEKVLLKSTFKVNETVIKADPSDSAQSARLRIQFDSFNLAVEAFGGAVQQDLLPKDIQAQLNEFVKRAEAYGLLNKFGEMYRSRVNPPQGQNLGAVVIVSEFTEEALQSLVVTSIPMPNKQVNAGETWTGVKEIRGAVLSGPVRLGPMGQMQPPKAHEFRYRDQVTYRYVGVRERAGKKEALVEVDGKSVQAPGSRAAVTGSIKGLAWVEIESGIVLKAKIEKDFQIDTSRDGQKKKLSGVYNFEVDRGAAQ